MKFKLPKFRGKHTYSGDKIFVIVRTDIPKVQQTIQAVHASERLAAKASYNVYCPSLALLKVSNGFKLRLLMLYLDFRCVEYIKYYDRLDKNSCKDTLTSVAFYRNICGEYAHDTENLFGRKRWERGNVVWFLKLWSP